MSLGTSDLVKEKFESELVETVEPTSRYAPVNTGNTIEVDEQQPIRVAYSGVLNGSIGYSIPALADTAIEYKPQFEREIGFGAAIAVIFLSLYIYLQFKRGNQSWAGMGLQYLTGFVLFGAKYLLM